MNLYLVDAGEVTFYGGEWEPPETERAINIVRALTRSQAQYLFWQQMELFHEGDLHEFNYRTLLLKRGVDGGFGVVASVGDPLYREGWELADKLDLELRPWQEQK